jgi:GNAT superfamily N-acetyltransferase
VIRIRLGDLSDIPSLEAVERETSRLFSALDLPPELAQPLPEAQVAAGISASLLWVAEESSSGAIGFVLCERPIPSCLHIREMDVRPDFGRRGIGAQLLASACTAAHDFGVKFVTLTTFSHLRWNAPFYANHGFRIVEDLAPFPHLVSALENEREVGLRNRVAMLRSAA